MSRRSQCRFSPSLSILSLIPSSTVMDRSTLRTTPSVLSNQRKVCNRSNVQITLDAYKKWNADVEKEWHEAGWLNDEDHGRTSSHQQEDELLLEGLSTCRLKFEDSDFPDAMFDEEDILVDPGYTEQGIP